MTVLLVCLVVGAAWMFVLPLLLRELVARRARQEVLETARHHLGPDVTLDVICNRRAFVCEDQRHAQNPANTGFYFFYDCRAADLHVRGRAPEAAFWSVSIHDRFSRPIESFLIDEQVRAVDGHYQLCLTTRPQPGVPNQLDVSSLPQGVVMLRISHLASALPLSSYLPSLHEQTWVAAPLSGEEARS